MKLNLQNNAISFTLKNIFSFDEKWMQQRKIMWKSRHLKSGSIPNKYHCSIYWVHIIVCLFRILQIRWQWMESKTKKDQFQFGYMLNLGLNINKASKEKFGDNIAMTFSFKMMTPISKVLRK